MNKQWNRTIWIHALLIMAFGLVSLYSASYDNLRVSSQVFYDQLTFVGLAVLIMYWISRRDYRKFYDVAYVLFAINLALLVGVHVAGRHALGARRWIELGGLSFQPSELMKLSLILLLGRYLSTRRPALSFDLVSVSRGLWRNLILPLLLTVVPVLLIFKQPDLGTAILLMGIFLIMIFMSGLEFQYLGWLLGVSAAGLPLLWCVMKQYQKDRLLVFLNPNIDPLGAGYTIIQSKIAVGSGGLWGKGWLSGTQNQLNFLPERHTDFIFSVIGEEWGLVGALALVYCYFMVVRAGLDIAEHTKDNFGRLVAVGIVGILMLQVFINIGMVIGLCPVVGITLPFISYGRTSFLVFAILLGFLLSLSRRRNIF